jgi:septal ring factor EnvC (AmiA/AmiB activator)
VESAAISKDIEQLEGELASLRARVEEDNSSFSALEGQIAALKQRLSETQNAVRTQEAHLAEKRDELSKAQHLERLEAFEKDLAGFRDARARVGKAASAFLAEVEQYDGEAVRLRKLGGEMRDAFGDDERVAQIEAALNDEGDELNDAWKAVVGAAQWRIREAPKDEDAEKEDGDLADDLQKRTEENRASRSRILDYFSKS